MPVGGTAFTVLVWAAVALVLGVFTYVAYSVVRDFRRSPGRTT